MSYNNNMQHLNSAYSLSALSALHIITLTSTCFIPQMTTWQWRDSNSQPYDCESCILTTAPSQQHNIPLGVMTTVAQNAISPFPSFIRFSRCFCSPHGTIQRMLGSYSLTISIRSPCLRFSHHNVTLRSTFPLSEQHFGASHGRLYIFSG